MRDARRAAPSPEHWGPTAEERQPRPAFARLLDLMGEAGRAARENGPAIQALGFEARRRKVAGVEPDSVVDDWYADEIAKIYAPVPVIAQAAERRLREIVGADGPAHVAAVIEEEIYAVEGEEF